MKCINCDQNFIRNYNRATDINGGNITVCPHCGHKEIYKKRKTMMKKKLNEIEFVFKIGW